MKNLSTDEHFLEVNAMLKMFYCELLPAYMGSNLSWCNACRSTTIAKHRDYCNILYWLKIGHVYDVKRVDIINYGIRFKSNSY